MSATFHGQLTTVPSNLEATLASITESLDGLGTIEQVAHEQYTATVAATAPSEQITVDNVIRISFPIVSSELKSEFRAIKERVDAWHGWVSAKCGQLIRNKQAKGELPTNLENWEAKLKIDNFTARVYENYLRQGSPW